MKLLTIFILALIILAPGAHAASIIRDTELETSIREVAEPVFKAAGLPSRNIQIYIVNNPEINAYVSGGSNIFIHTGLLSLSKNPDMLVGVIAHETGHITGGHLLKGAEEARNTMVKSTFGYMLGLAAAAAGSPQAGMAIASGSQHVAEREILKHTRTQEESADQAALNFLGKAGISAQGLLDVLEVLYGKEVGIYNEINPYTMTHPLSRERIDHVRNYLKTSHGQPLSGDIVKEYSRSIVKLDAFLQPSNKTLKQYPVSDASVNARYARAIGYYRIPNLTKAIAEIDSLISEYPSDPYFQELKGQILFENGKPSEAIAYYQKARELLESSALLKVQLATAQIASEKPQYLTPAVANLEQALNVEKRNNFAWHQLGIAYGRMGKLDMSNLALAEEYAIRGEKAEARRFIAMARKYTKPGSPTDLRLNDLESLVSKDKNKEN